MRALILSFLIFLTTLCGAQEVKVIQKVAPKPFAISHNVVFLVDASSTINNYGDAKAKFSKGWDIIVDKFASDELYFRTYVFHDIGKERKTKWVDAGGPDGLKKFAEAKEWVQKNTGMYSWGLKALRCALREKNPMDKNPSSARRLTIVILTDGGFTEAAGNKSEKSTKDIINSPLKDHIYRKTGSFKVLSEVIEYEQARRVANDLAKATIVTIGLQNLIADREYGPSVKQPDFECQKWLKKIGSQYNGGYLFVWNEEAK